MYDIFDDIFDDGGYGMSAEDVDAELAFEAAMDIDDYDPAYEGFGDVMGKIGQGIQNFARNAIRKIKELFVKIGQFIREKFAGMRLKGEAKDSKTLAKLLEKLDSRVKQASPETKRETKAKVDAIKRRIMGAIDANRSMISKVNTTLSNSVTIFKALQTIGNQYITKMKSMLDPGNNEDNDTTGNDLAERVNALLNKMRSVDSQVADYVEDLKDALEIKDTEQAYGFNAGKLSAIMKEVTFSKVDFRAVYAAAKVADDIAKTGQDAADDLGGRLNNQRRTYQKAGIQGSVGNERSAYRMSSGRMTWTDINANDNDAEDIKFKGTTTENAHRLLTNWNDYAKSVTTGCQMLNHIKSQVTSVSNGGSSVENKTSGREFNSVRGADFKGKPDYTTGENYGQTESK